MSKHTNKFAKRATILVGGIAAIFGLSGCTKSFCSNQDKANQLYAAYGNIFSETIDQPSYEGDDSISDADKELADYALQTRNNNRTALFQNLTNSYGYSLPDVAFQNFITEKATAKAEETKVLWTDGTLAELEEKKAYNVAFHVALYAGLDEENKVTDLWSNFDTWYDLAVADPTIGVLKAPSSGYVASMKTLMEQTIMRNTSCISPSDKEINSGGTVIYVEGKTWGQAFSEYGFLEGLLVYPLSWIVHVITEGLNDTIGAQLLAIFVVTLLVRAITVLSSIFQSKSQARQQIIQPKLNELQKKYPDQTDPEQRRNLAMAQSKLMRENRVHPFLPIIFMILQFPLFICIWSALQGSAALANGSFFGLPLTTPVSSCFTQFGSTPGAWVGIVIFFLMSLSNILTSFTGMWFNSWKTKKFGPSTPQQVDKNGNPVDPNKTMKYMTIFMSVFVVIMGFSLPTAMGIYWLIGSLMSIAQTLLTEGIQARSRHKAAANTGDGTTLAAVRRSKHHTDKNGKNDKKNKKGKNQSDKPLWR